MTISVKNKILITVISAIVISTTVTFFLISGITKKNIQKNTKKDLIDMVEIAHSILKDLDVNFIELEDAFNKDIKIDENGFLFVIDPKGKFLIHPKVQGENWSNRPFIKKIIEEKTGYLRYLSPKTNTYKVAAYKYCKKHDIIISATNFEDDALKTPMKEIRSRFFIIIFPVIFILSGIIFFIVNKLIIKPLNKISDNMRDISQGEGDLTKRLEIYSKDEIGNLANCFNVFVEKIHKIIIEISESTETLANSETELDVIADEMAKGVNSTIEKSNTVAAAAEEMSLNMDAVGHSMKDTTDRLNTVSAGTEEMSSSINEIAQNASKSTEITRNAVKQAEKASMQMEELGNAASEIVKVTDTIAEISDQTNLLALNATIEAARAGDTGKGFAVVANEIKELARQTADATEEIAKQLNGVQQTSKNTAVEIKNITEIIDEIDTIVGAIAVAVEEQNATTSENTRGITEISGNIKEINENISQSNSASAQIAEEIANVNHSTNEMGNSTNMVLHSSEELSKMVEQLKGIVGQFKV